MSPHVSVFRRIGSRRPPRRGPSLFHWAAFLKRPGHTARLPGAGQAAGDITGSQNRSETSGGRPGLPGLRVTAPRFFRRFFPRRHEAPVPRALSSGRTHVGPTPPRALRSRQLHETGLQSSGGDRWHVRVTGLLSAGRRRGRLTTRACELAGADGCEAGPAEAGGAGGGQAVPTGSQAPSPGGGEGPSPGLTIEQGEASSRTPNRWGASGPASTSPAR